MADLKLPVFNITEENFLSVLKALRAPFKKSEVSYRELAMPGSKQKPRKLAEIRWNNKPESDKMWKGVKGVDAIAPVAFYVDQRVIEDRLDYVVGPNNWQTRVVMHPDGAIMELGIKINGEWIWKADGSERTHIEGFKGAISKAQVRVGSSWGIGRYFYDIKINFPVQNKAGDGKAWYFHQKYSGTWKEPTDLIPEKYLPSN